MATGIEAGGDAMTGAIIGRAVEPDHGEGHTAGRGNCRNCDAALVGNHCHDCGQAAHVHRSLSAIGHDIAHGVFHIEGKIWRTLPMLLFKPGQLTRRYVHGQRARFVSPLALFLFSVFLMFAAVESAGGPVLADKNKGDAKVLASAIVKQITDAKTRLEALRADRARMVAARESTVDIDGEIFGAQSEIAGLVTANSLTMSDSTIAGVLPKSLPKGAHASLGWKNLDAEVNKALLNPELLVYKLQSSAYKFAWALIPLSLPFMWLMFAWRREHKLYDHAIFVTYSLSAIMLMTVAMALLAAFGVNGGFIVLLIPIHFFLQLKGAYALGIPGALVRTVFLIVASLVVMTLFSVILLMLGLLG